MLVGEATMRRMRDPDYRADQWLHRYDEHVAEFNHLVERWAVDRELPAPPLVPPHLGGTRARVVCVFQDPRPAAGGPRGSGFISWENDDPSAERHKKVAIQAGLADTEVVSFNSYLWYINAKPSTAQLLSSLDDFLSLLSLVREPDVIIFHGGVAHSLRRLLDRHRPGWSPVRTSPGAKWNPHAGFSEDDHVLLNYHTSNQAQWSSDANERQRRQQHLERAYARAAAFLI